MLDDWPRHASCTDIDGCATHVPHILAHIYESMPSFPPPLLQAMARVVMRLNCVREDYIEWLTLFRWSNPLMVQRDIFVIGASAGGVEALTQLVRALPGDLPGSLFVVLHTAAGRESHLPDLLKRAGTLDAVHVDSVSTIEPGKVYVARPNLHLIIEDSRTVNAFGPKVNLHRPSIDLLFQTAAKALGSRVAGIVLSGSLDDGTLGLQSIMDAGGVSIVQDPDEALFNGMPLSALSGLEVDYCEPIEGIARLLVDLARGRDPGEEVMLTQHQEPLSPKSESNPGAIRQQSTTVTGFSCPECGGVLREERYGDLIHFRCHVGHELSEHALLNAQPETLESALWIALRVLEERIALAQKLVESATDRGHMGMRARFEQRQLEARRNAETIRRVLIGTDQHRPLIELLDEISVELDPRMKRDRAHSDDS
jgi:two-component system, chemotaxis family, protein-glutamate methylesterase/glutaminase